MSEHNMSEWIDVNERLEAKLKSSLSEQGYYAIRTDDENEILVATTEYRAAAETIVKRVNALSGIPDPEQWVEDMKAENQRLKTLTKRFNDILRANPEKFGVVIKELNLCQRCNQAEATKDYNGHGHMVCEHCYKMLENEFEDEYK